MTSLQRATILLLTAATQLFAHSAAADHALVVTQSAAFAGNFGLEVAIAPCSVTRDVILSGPPPTVSGVVEACTSVTAHDVTVANSGAVFRAGKKIVLGNGFQMKQGATLELIIDRAFVQDRSPAAERTYRASYYLRLDELTLGESEDVVNFTGVSSNDEAQFRVFLRKNTELNENRLLLAARLDDGTELTTPWGEQLLLPASWNHIEVDWRAGPGTGYLLVSINESVWLGLTDLDNDAGKIDSVQWGAMGSDGGLPGEISGIMHLDEFRSWR